MTAFEILVDGEPMATAPGYPEAVVTATSLANFYAGHFVDMRRSGDVEAEFSGDDAAWNDRLATLRVMFS